MTYVEPARTGTFDSSASTSFVQGGIYQCIAGRHTGLVFKCLSDATLTLDIYVLGLGGKLYQVAGNMPIVQQVELFNGSGWGDDSRIRVTASGSDTFVDLNGNTNLSVAHELAIPCGWTSNHARIGEQVSGVDL